jgi:hypothetical protein
MIFLKILLLLSLFFIAYEDFRYRAISLYAIVTLLALAVTYSFLLQNIKMAIQSVLINLVIITFQFALTWIYFIVFQRHRKGFLNKKLGVGDLLFYIPVLFLFSPLNFIFFHILSLSLVLCGFALYKAFVKPVKTIPLAGGLSVIFSGVLLISWIFPTVNLYDDMVFADLFYTLQLK